MKYVNLFIYTILLVVVLIISPKTFAATVATPSAKFVDDEIVVKLKPSAPSSDINPLAQAVSGEVVRELLLKDMFLLKIPKGSVDKGIKILSEMPQVATTSPNFIAQKQSITNDSSLDKQWGLFQIQAASSSTKSAWDKTTGRSEVKIAVLDTGIEKTHPDLDGKIIGEKNFSTSADLNDHDGHGTQVAGVIAATGNNAGGIAGVAYNSSLLNVKVLNDDGNGSYANIADGIIWAANSGAKVINLSLGGITNSEFLEEAINYAVDKGAVVVAAAGNSGNNTSFYPAEYDSVLSVGATDDTDTKLSSSNYGISIKIAAPGDKTYSTDLNNSYTFTSGTSMAAAFVSGVAGLVWSTDICATNDCVMNRIEQTADKVTETGKYWKYGRINALKAVAEVASVNTPSITIIPTKTLTVLPNLPPAPLITAEPSLTPTPTIQEKKVTISNIEMWTVREFALRNMFIRVTVIRQSDKTKLYNATVAIDLSGPDGSIYSGTSTTDIEGHAVFGLKPAIRTGVYKTQVTDVSMKEYSYKPTKISAELVTH